MTDRHVHAVSEQQARRQMEMGWKGDAVLVDMGDGDHALLTADGVFHAVPEAVGSKPKRVDGAIVVGGSSISSDPTSAVRHTPTKAEKP